MNRVPTSFKPWLITTVFGVLSACAAPSPRPMETAVGQEQLSSAPLAAEANTTGLPEATLSTRPAVLVADAEAADVLRCADPLRQGQPKPMRIITTEGRLPSDPLSRQSQAAREDWQGMLCLALATRLTGDAAYLMALERYLLAWSSVFEPQGNPISENTFEQVALAYRLVRADLNHATVNETMRLLRSMAAVLLDPARVRAGTKQNNWQSHRIKLFTAIAFALDDPALMNIGRTAFRRQIAQNIAPDGEVLDFRERDALHYVVYSLEPLLMASWIARQAGEDWYRYVAGNGASLSQALDWLTPYARGEKTHQEFLNSRVPLDHQRSAAGVAGFSGLWQPSRALNCYHLAADLDPRWQPLADHLGRAPSVMSVLARY